MTAIVLTLIATPAAQASSSGRDTEALARERVASQRWDVGDGRDARIQPVAVRVGDRPDSNRYLQAVTQRLRHGIQERRRAAQAHRRWLGLGPISTAYRERQTRSVPYLKWLKHLWSTRAHRLYKLRDRTLRNFPYGTRTNAWLAAVEEVQRVFPGTSGWLLSCSAAEGGHGRWVGYGGQAYSTWLRDSDTVGGPLQFRFSTFTGMFRRGLEHVHSRGYRTPRELQDMTSAWRSALGQAIAGGWARFTGNDNRHWEASWSNGCR